jgi:hypothetical protein
MSPGRLEPLKEAFGTLDGIHGAVLDINLAEPFAYQKLLLCR